MAALTHPSGSTRALAYHLTNSPVLTEYGPSEEYAIILYDGVCNLCNAAVRFVLAIDHNDVFQFASLQSEAGKKLATKYNLTMDLSTFFLLEEGKTYERSDAWLKILRRVGWPWSAFYSFRLLPRPIRDWFYDVVGRNRYRWFGIQEYCAVPRPELRWKFLS